MCAKENPSSEFTLAAERPIDHKSQDRLGRGHFVVRLARAIASWRGDDGLVIGLYGPWGTGKSSVKNLVIEELRATNSRNTEILEFNPWQWHGHDNVSSAFFREVSRKLGSIHQTKDKGRIAKKFRRYAKFLGIGVALFDGFPKIAGAVLILIGLLGITLSSVSLSLAATVGKGLAVAITCVAAILIWGERVLERVAEWLESQLEDQSSLEEQKQAIATELRKYDKTLLVVIDDVDRLSPAEISQVFQLIKANADFPRFVYLLLFQRDIVVKALEREMGGDGAKFLEKIIQISFDLPIARREEIEKILFEGLDGILGKDAEKVETTYWGNVYYGGLWQYFTNLREVKRFLGVFRFQQGLLRSENVLEVHPVDLIALETIALYEPALYGLLATRQSLLTGRTVLGDRNRGEMHKECQSLLELVAEQRREGIREVLKELFPPVADAFGGMQHDSSFAGGWLGELRVCSPEIFSRYFERSLAPQDVSQAEILRLVGLGNDARAFTSELKRYASEGRLTTVIDRLGPAIVSKSHSIEVADVLIALFNAGEELPEGAQGFFGFPPHWPLLNLVSKVLLVEKDQQEREQKLERAIREADGLSMAIMEVGHETDPNARQKKSQSDLAIRDESITRFKNLCIERIRKAAADGLLYRQRDLAFLLYRWREWANSQEVVDWVSNLTVTPEGAIEFLKAFLGSGTSQGVDDKLPRIRWYIKLSDTEKFADSDRIENILKDATLSSLPERDRLAVEEFRKALKRKREGKREDDVFWRDDEE